MNRRHKWIPLTSAVPVIGHVAIFWCDRCGALRMLRAEHPDTEWLRAVGDWAWSEERRNAAFDSQYAHCPMLSTARYPVQDGRSARIAITIDDRQYTFNRPIAEGEQLVVAFRRDMAGT